MTVETTMCGSMAIGTVLNFYGHTAELWICGKIDERKCNMKKYTVDYCSANTGLGWTKEYDRLDEFEPFVNECRHEYGMKVRVWDNELNQVIFQKGCSWKPEVDMLHDILRDMRTVTRRAKLHKA